MAQPPREFDTLYFICDSKTQGEIHEDKQNMQKLQSNEKTCKPNQS